MSLAMQAKKFINSEHVGEYIDLAGKAMHYMRCGAGEPLILIHGIGQSIYTWREMFQQLGKNFSVFALDLIGQGYSSRPQDFEYTIAQQAETIHEFMNAMNIESAHIVAFSTGAVYALNFSQQHPEKVGDMVIISPGGLTPSMPFLVHALTSPLFGGLISKLFTVKSVRSVLDECFFDHTVMNEELVSEYYTPISDSASRNALHLSLKNFDEEETLQGLRYIAHNTLILLGEEDKWHTKSMAEAFHAAIRNSEFSIVRNCGHFVHEEKPQRIVEMINEFLIPAEPVEVATDQQE